PAVTETVVTPAAFDVAATYQMTCFACHSTGAAGAPMTGDSAAWEARMAKGMDTVLANAMNGLNAMPAKGMCMTCSESDMRSLMEYIMNPN
ncbi:MAG: c-type cytochrome, partial [Pseudohongiellaceae bacterium]